MFSKLISLASAAFGSVLAGHHATNQATWSPTSYQLNVDNSTYANADQIHTPHFHVDWKISFDEKVIYGAVTHDLEVLQDTTQLVLDSWLINIESAELLPAGSAIARINDPSIQQTGESLSWQIAEVNPILGSALII
jgi:leukotriene-A4 hydrolase